MKNGRNHFPEAKVTSLNVLFFQFTVKFDKEQQQTLVVYFSSTISNKTIWLLKFIFYLMHHQPISFTVELLSITLYTVKDKHEKWIIATIQMTV